MERLARAAESAQNLGMRTLKIVAFYLALFGSALLIAWLVQRCGWVS